MKKLMVICMVLALLVGTTAPAHAIKGACGLASIFQTEWLRALCLIEIELSCGQGVPDIWDYDENGKVWP